MTVLILLDQPCGPWDTFLLELKKKNNGGTVHAYKHQTTSNISLAIVNAGLIYSYITNYTEMKEHRRLIHLQCRFKVTSSLVLNG